MVGGSSPYAVDEVAAMVKPIFAMPPPGWVQVLVVAMVAAVVAAVAWTRIRRGRSSGGRLALLALIVGPLAGLALAGLFFALEEVDRLDVGYYIASFATVGTIAGLLGALAFGLACLISKPVDRSPGQAGVESAERP
jgi:hypothetical protein